MADTDSAPAAATAKTVVGGALWNYLAQIFTVLVQLLYAATNSRVLGDHAFGVYGAAFTSMLFVNLLATAGLTQTVGRMTELHGSRLSGLLIYAVIVGLLAAGALFLTAGFWSAVWGTPQAADTTRVLSATSFLTPIVALASGLSYRLGRFRSLAVVTFVANVSGMILGAAAVFVFRTPESLAVSTISAQAGIAGAVLLLMRRQFHGRPSLRQTLADIGYSARIATSGVLSYSAGNVGRITFSRIFGAGPLGQWNRADALTTAPFWQLQSAMIQAVYPEFRHDLEPTERTRRVWADLVVMMAWICLPLAAVEAVLAPVVVGLVLGPHWGLAAQFLPALALIGGVLVPVTLLVSALEALGRFAWLWIGFGLNLACNLIGSTLGAALHSAEPLFIGIGLGVLVMHVYQIERCTRNDLLDLRRLLIGYAQVVTGSVLVACIAGLMYFGFELWNTAPWLLPLATITTTVSAVLLWRNRRDLWPVRLASRYGVLQRGTRPHQRPAA